MLSVSKKTAVQLLERYDIMLLSEEYVQIQIVMLNQLSLVNIFGEMGTPHCGTVFNQGSYRGLEHYGFK